MIHKVRFKNQAAEVETKIKHEAAIESPKTVYGGGGTGHKNDAIVIENVDNGYIVRVICASLEQETVMVYSHEQRSEMLHFIASCA